MQRARWIVVSLLALALIAFGSYTWTNALLDSLLAYRSPLRATPPPAGAPLGQPLTTRVVLVVVDALREDTSRNPAVMPFLNQLRNQGAWVVMHSRPPSWSQTNWTVICTGAWPEINDAPAINVDYDEIWPWTQDNIFAAAKRAGLKTAVSGYDWWGKFILPQWRDASFFTRGEDDAADRDVLNAALPWLKSGEYPFVLIHLDQVDYAGHHEGGPRDPRWNAAATRADAMIQQIAGTLDFKKDTLIIVSDHGQIDRGGHGGQDPITLVEPFVMVGAGVKPGQYPDMQMVDVAPTMAVLLGTNLPASSEGQPITWMLNIGNDQQPKVTADWNAQQATLALAYETAIQMPQQNGKTAYERIMATRTVRDVRERLPRLIAILIMTAVAISVISVAIYPARSLLQRRGRNWVKLLLAAVLYITLYNIIFAVITGNVYSMSTVSGGATSFIIEIAKYTLLAVIPAWFIAMLLSNAFRQGALHAAQATFGFAFITIFLLYIPALIGFAVNGVTTTWRLPDPLIVFLHFTNLIQAMLVAALGIVLSGIAALIGWRMKSGTSNAKNQA